MCRLVETVCLEGGRVLRASYHEARMNAARKELFGTTDYINICRIIRCGFEQRTRCRIVYETDVESIEYIPYHLRQVRTLKLVEADEGTDYHLKYANRSCLDALFALRGQADEVLIVKNGRLTDTSIGNVALYDGAAWHTPAYPLLRGTHRQYLIDHGILKERDIKVEDMAAYKGVRIFKAMIHGGEVELPMSSVDSKITAKYHSDENF